jgi:hypothetical protein
MKSTTDKPRDLAASIRQRLLNGAKERGEEFTFVLTRFALERLLFRLGQSRHAGQFVLNGAMLADQGHTSPTTTLRHYTTPSAAAAGPQMAVERLLIGASRETFPAVSRPLSPARPHPQKRESP